MRQIELDAQHVAEIIENLNIGVIFPTTITVEPHHNETMRVCMLIEPDGDDQKYGGYLVFDMSFLYQRYPDAVLRHALREFIDRTTQQYYREIKQPVRVCVREVEEAR